MPRLIRIWMVVVCIYNFAGAFALLYFPHVLEHLFPGVVEKLGGQGGLLTRILVCWILTFAILRVCYVLAPDNRPVFFATFASFVIWFAWSMYESLVLRTMPFESVRFGVLMGTISMALMSNNYPKLNRPKERTT